MTQAAPKVAIICNTFSASFVFRKTLIQKLSQAGRLASVVSLIDDSTKLPNGVDHVPRIVTSARPSDLLRTAQKLRRADTQVCHGFTHAGNMVAFVLALMLHTPVVMNVTGMGRAFSSKGARNVLMRFFILGFYSLAQFRVRAVIVQNMDDHTLISRVFLPRTRSRILKTNGSGITLDFFAGVQPAQIGLSKTQLKVGFFSRALPEKGVLDYYALALAYQGRSEVEFFHIGHAGAGDFAPERIAMHAAASNVTYLSFQPDPRPYQLAMDVIVLPSSYREGFSRLCIEVMLAGKVVVAQDTTGVREHVVSGRNGFLYDRAEALPGAFAAALRSDLGAIGAAAQEHARRHFDVATVDQTYVNCYLNSQATE